MAAPGVAVPGSVVAIGSQTSPAGAQGIAGTNAITTTSAGFTVPAIGSTVSATVNDASWIVVGQMVYVDQAGGSGLAGILQVTAKAGNTLTLLNPQPAPAIPLASSAGAGLMATTSGNTTDFIDGTNASQNLVTAVQPILWYAKTRNYNSLGNSTFEIDQRNVGGTLSNPANLTFLADRWQLQKSALTGVVSSTRLAQSFQPGNVWPGTSFLVSQNRIYLALTTAQASLAAGDFYMIEQQVESPCMRELENDLTSLSFMVQSSVSPLKFSCFIRDSANGYSLVKLCTYNVGANSWQAFTFPAIPVFPSAGTFGVTPGTLAYTCGICLACGTTFTAPSLDVWNAGNFLGAATMDNWLSKPISTTSFSIGFFQHEPGQYCTGPIDLPFQQAYDDALRYYQKTYDFATAIGTVVTRGAQAATGVVSNTYGIGTITFEKAMAKVPTIVCYSDATGAANNVRDADASVDRAVSNVVCNSKRIVQVNLSAAGTVNNRLTYHYTADTGW